MNGYVTMPRALNNLVILNVLMVSFVALASGVFLYSLVGIFGLVVPVVLAGFLSYLFFKKENK